MNSNFQDNEELLFNELSAFAPADDIACGSAAGTVPAQDLHNADDAADVLGASINEDDEKVELDAEEQLADGGPADNGELPEQAKRIAIIEAILFAAPSPVKMSELQDVCGWPAAMIEDDLMALGESLRGRGIVLHKAAGAWSLMTSPDTLRWVAKFLKVQNRRRLTRAQMETLAVVAYRQPVTRSEIDAYRGVRSERYVRQLEDLKLIRETGRANVPGHPLLYCTTSNFLRYFGLNSLDMLPTIERDNMTLRKRGPFIAYDSSEDIPALKSSEMEAAVSMPAAEHPEPEIKTSRSLQSLFEKIRRSRQSQNEEKSDSPSD